MATQKPIISVVLDEETLKRVDDFMFSSRLRSRSKAIGELVKLALADLEDVEVKDIDPLDEMGKLIDLLADMKKDMEKKRKEGE